MKSKEINSLAIENLVCVDVDTSRVHVQFVKGARYYTARTTDYLASDILSRSS